MRPIYTSPRPENIDRVVAMFEEHGIETRVTNRAVYDRPSYKRFSYGASEDRARWARVEVVRAADLTRARALLRDAGVEPLTRHAEVLAEAREIGGGRTRRQSMVSRTRLLSMAAVLTAVVMLILKFFHVV